MGVWCQQKELHGYGRLPRCSFAWTPRCLTYVRVVVKRSCLPTSWVKHNRFASSTRGSQRAGPLSLAVAPRVDRFPVAYLDNLVQALSDNAISLIDAYDTERRLLRRNQCPRFNRARRKESSADYRFQKGRDKLHLRFSNQVRRLSAPASNRLIPFVSPRRRRDLRTAHQPPAPRFA